MHVEFRVLGAVEAVSGGTSLDLGHARQRSVLAVLLLAANQPVPADQLLDRVWGEQQPQRGRDALYGYLSRLRGLLPDDVAIVKRPAGYVLTVDENTIDLHRFRRLAAQARAATLNALALFDEALSLWRGEAFTGTDSEWLTGMRTALNAERRAVQLDRIDAALNAGRHTDVLDELATLADDDPLDERVVAQLLLALYRAGRPAEALQRYHRLREQLADRLGTDPGPALRGLHQRILTADPELDSPGSTLVPRQLPAAPVWFTGRSPELDRMTATTGTMVVSAIAGAGGIGKTWLALEWAHRHVAEFPDGQLFVDLQGFSPTAEPVPPTVALRGFLGALGVEPGKIPADLAAQSALFRSTIAAKRLLIVLDNAADPDQVVPLLPGTATSVVVITSRRQLTRLVTRYGAGHLRLGVLTEDEARRLLISWLGEERIQAEPDAVAELLACCGGFPLALGIVAGRAHTDPDVSLKELAGDLRSGISALDDEDPSTSLPAVLSWSLRALAPAERTLFGLLGIAPGPDISHAAATALAGLPSGETSAILHSLEQLSLVERDTAGRYRMHDLVRQYAREHVEADPQALRRVIDFYLHTAISGHDVLDPHATPIEHDDPAPGAQPLSLDGDRATMAWFDAEDPCLLAAQQEAFARGWYRTAWQLAGALSTYQYLQAHMEDTRSIWQIALAATEHLDDPNATVVARRNLGNALIRLRRADEAIEHLDVALDLARRNGDRHQEAVTLSSLTSGHAALGQHREALARAQESLAVYREMANPGREAMALNAVGWCAAQVGEYDSAREHCEAALELFRKHHNDLGEAATLDSLGYIADHSDQHGKAVDHYREALEIRRKLGHTYQVADTLDRLGHAYTALGESAQARAAWAEALDLYRAQGRDADATRVRLALTP
ncbi:AfsR/SARP family transcriptional regulator [Kutzneria chonburiensis]|uniref:BTAD domain-containing putative transcriptional regulator n=1 Tax=Kutzneria chonburiensis TaxID=1483604 RepID=A0ABV6MN10_9PSEU|nr:BTAD domain-containing putative transcriptional regulator [Kutzneria chonburiensis]